VNEDKATRYHRLKRRTGLCAAGWTALVLALMLGTGASRALAAWAESIAHQLTSGPWTSALVVVLYVAVLSLVHEIGSAPLAFYSGFRLEHRYGLSSERLGEWLRDRLKSLAIGLTLGAAAASVMYVFIRRWPGAWWLPTGAIFALVTVGLTNLAPVFLVPLFYRVRPLDRAALTPRLLALAERAGARVLGAYEWGLGAKTRKANAALAGLGTTRRILVSDTLLAEYSDEEIEIVLAHELGHHVHGDIWKGLAFESALMLTGFYAASRALEVFAPRLGLAGASDPAGLPLLLLAAGAVSVVLLPVAHALSRAHERSADRFALELTRNPAAFISTMRRLAAQNLAEERPSRLIRWLFYSHPPIAERIAAAQGFKR
jgi:STE24 endopeptidase